MKTYDLIKTLLQEETDYRNDDKKLIWAVWEAEFNVFGGTMTKEQFLSAKSTETIRRTRQKIQQNHPELQANAVVKSYRKKIQAQKGTHVYRDDFGNRIVKKVGKRPFKMVIGKDNIARKVYV